MSERMYATIGVGMEQIVSRELGALGIAVTRIEPGRARFEGSADDLYRALLHVRCASRIVRELELEELGSEEDLYDVVRTIDWSHWITPDKTFRVHFNVHSSLLRNTRYGLYRIKDAICDQVVDRTGRRPSVDTVAPDVHVSCTLENRRLSVGLDAAGDPLHMRGYRVAQHETSLREHLAAAMVLQSGWDGSQPLHDPFCGSATILTEAALIATSTPPSHFRERFGCMGWPDFDPARFAQLRHEARGAIRSDVPLRISGADRDAKVLELARRNVEAAGFGSLIALQQRDVAQMPPQEGGWIVTNPPYGVRVGERSELLATWQSFRASAIRCHGARVAVIAEEEGFEKAFGLRPFKRNRMNNGPIRCVLAQYEIR